MELSFRAIYSWTDSLCRNHMQNAFVIFNFSKLRFHPCAPYPSPLTLPLPPPTLRSGGGGRERESLFKKGGAQERWRSRREISSHRIGLLKTNIKRRKRNCDCWTLSEYMYVVICADVYLQRSNDLERSTHWRTACVETISKMLLFSLNWT